MKIAVYGLAKNDLSLIDRWINSVSPADYLVIGDLGSSDGSVDVLRSKNVTVHEISVQPLRFDRARNTVLNLLPNEIDVCISCDLREFMMPGWRSNIEKSWLPGSTRMVHSYVQSFNLNQYPPFRSAENMIHARHGSSWRRPIRERLGSAKLDKWITNLDIVVCHNGDPYIDAAELLSLLKVSRDEDPACLETLFLFGSELAHRSIKPQAIAVLHKFLDTPSVGLSVERSEAWRLLAVLEPHEKLKNLRMSAVEDQTRREPWLDLCEHYLKVSDWSNLHAACNEAMKIQKSTLNTADTPGAWGNRFSELQNAAMAGLGISK
jgi:hypothetical protein